IKNYWSLFGIDFQFNEINVSSIFFRSAPLILEIGFGSGRSLVQSAIDHPEKNFIGIEVYKSGIGSCLKNAFFSQLKNLKII
ncbi:tRNA (guanosine(46)-N7)-methyltransferase TrmB, partial [Buchnera aphidicola]|nr:tRNA (guanosine(46)-N7)-methyltransferase TrmB [Buchnera aphidicola]